MLGNPLKNHELEIGGPGPVRHIGRGLSAAREFVPRSWKHLLGFSVISLCILAVGADSLRAQTNANPSSQGVNVRQGQENSRAAVDMPDVDTRTPSVAAKTNKKSDPVLLDPAAYMIGEQDSLLITVWKEKEMSGDVIVRPDGKITVPLVGEIKVVGMTPVQLQTLLMEKLKPFVTVPQVTVSVAEIRSRKVYLIGHAAREGSFTINSSTTVLQIIAQAGGLRDFAKRKKIYILRQQGGQQVRFPFNYDNVIKGKSMQQNILLEPGDTIVVP
jgi:polysaccharide biosynthesis/export protein